MKLDLLDLLDVYVFDLEGKYLTDQNNSDHLTFK